MGDSGPARVRAVGKARKAARAKAEVKVRDRKEDKVRAKEAGDEKGVNRSYGMIC